MRVQFRNNSEGLVIMCSTGLKIFQDISGDAIRTRPATHWNENLLSRLNSFGLEHSPDGLKEDDIMVVWLDGPHFGYACDLSKILTAPPIWRRETTDVDINEALSVLGTHFGCEVNLVGEIGQPCQSAQYDSK